MIDKTDLTTKVRELAKSFSKANDAKADVLYRIDLDKAPLQDLLDYVRVCIKYHKLDIEATSRENQYLRGLLQSDQDSGPQWKDSD